MCFHSRGQRSAPIAIVKFMPFKMPSAKTLDRVVKYVLHECKTIYAYGRQLTGGINYGNYQTKPFVAHGSSVLHPDPPKHS